MKALSRAIAPFILIGAVAAGSTAVISATESGATAHPSTVAVAGSADLAMAPAFSIEASWASPCSDSFWM